MTVHTRPWKEKELSELSELVNSKPVIGVIDLHLFPAALFADLRKKLSKKATFKVSKTKIIQKALLSNKEKLALNDFVGQSCGLVFTEMNPFELFAFLKKNKGKVSAKIGQIAPEDIQIPAGDTGLPPGPALSDLKAAGLEVRVQGQTITITKDKIVTKKGEPVSKPVAGTLSKLDIKPIKIGLKLVAVFEEGQIFKASVLDIETEKVFEEFVCAHTNSFNLAFNSGYFTTQTIPLFISKAFNNAKAVALESNLFTKETMPILLAKAVQQAKALQSQIPQTKQEVSEPKKEEPGKEKEAVEKKEGKEEAQEQKEEPKKDQEKKEGEKEQEERKEALKAVQEEQKEEPKKEETGKKEEGVEEDQLKKVIDQTDGEIKEDA